MYKTKLQELCQWRSWRLPEYDTTRDGPDHNPSFTATVTVNGYSFVSPSPAKSSKLAQNDAAQLAFDYFFFSSSSSSSSSSSPRTTLTAGSSSASVPMNVTAGTSIAMNEPRRNTLTEKTAQEKAVEMNLAVGNAIALVAQNDDGFSGVEHLYKNQLQSYAQRNNLTLPVYHCEREGPPHASRFKSSVTIDRKTYESREFFPTLNKAEHAAARVALVSLLPNGVEVDESSYKSLLQELAQKEGYNLPTYDTNVSGESHQPTFVSTVEIDGKSFTGCETRTKKQAEMSAARVAYTALKQCKSNQSPACFSSVLQAQGQETVQISSSSMRSYVAGNSSQSPTNFSPAHQGQEAVQFSSSNVQPKHAGNSIQGPTKFSLACQGQEPAQLSSSGAQPDHAGNSSQHSLPPGKGKEPVQFSKSSMRSDLIAYLQKHVQPEMPTSNEQANEDSGPESSTAISRASSSSGLSCPSLPEHDMPSLPSDSSTGSAVCSTVEQLIQASTSSHEGIIVHPRATSMTYPAGSTVLPFSNDDWVAVKVTFQSSQ